MKRLIMLLLLMSVPAIAQASALDSCRAQIKYGAPSYSGVLLCRLSYVLSYNTAHKTPDWVAYHLTREQVRGNIPRTNDFRTDPDLAPDQQAASTDYGKGQYVPGQFVPAASMRSSARAMSESFLLSNTAPQLKSMNSGIWKALNQKVRDWVNSRGELYVVAGTIYGSSSPKTIGPDHVAVPSGFYQVIFDPVQVEAIAFVIPNRKEDPSDLPKFIVSIDQVEKVTGLDFLSNLSDPVESVIESKTTPFWLR